MSRYGRLGGECNRETVTYRYLPLPAVTGVPEQDAIFSCGYLPLPAVTCRYRHPRGECNPETVTYRYLTLPSVTCRYRRP